MKTQKHSVSIGFYCLAYEHCHRSGAQLEGKGEGLPLPFFENKKRALILGKKALTAPFLGLSFSFIM